MTKDMEKEKESLQKGLQKQMKSLQKQMNSQALNPRVYLISDLQSLSYCKSQYRKESSGSSHLQESLKSMVLSMMPLAVCDRLLIY